MSERRSPSASARAGKRGRHKHADSRETQRWNADHLVPPRPEWMSLETYRRLAELRERL
jgi:hypothetical protein